MEISGLEDLFIFMNKKDLEIIQCLQSASLIRKTKRCSDRRCRCYCKLWRRENMTLNHAFVCGKCRKQWSVFDGSYFENVHISIKNVLYIMWLWATQTRSGIASKILNIPRNSIYNQYRHIRDICSWKLLQCPDLFLVGGLNHIVQIDESVITKRKYNRGRIIPEKWLLCVYDVTEKRGVIMYISNRETVTLVKEIERCVKPGSEIWTDMWRGYNELSQLGNVSPYIHKTVNHNKHFVDAETHTCTNTVESYWSKLKTYLRQLGVLKSKLLPEHIDQFMWLQHFGGSPKDIYHNICCHISERYGFN